MVWDQFALATIPPHHGGALTALVTLRHAIYSLFIVIYQPLTTSPPFASPLGSQGYVYSTFLKPYNPLRDSQRLGQMCRDQQHQQQQQQQQEQHQAPVSVDEDFDDLSLFVSGSGSSSLHSFNLNTTDSSSTLSGLQLDQESPEDVEDTLENDAQQVKRKQLNLKNLKSAKQCHLLDF